MASLRSSIPKGLRTTTSGILPATESPLQRRRTFSPIYHSIHALSQHRGHPSSRRPQAQQVTHISTTIPSRSYSASGIYEQETTSSIAPKPITHPVFETTTDTFQYIIADPTTLTTIILDPVLDFNPCTSSPSTKPTNTLLSLIKLHGYNTEYILETHTHADRLSAASHLQFQLGTRPRASSSPPPRYSAPPQEHSAVFDNLLKDNEVLRVGAMHIKAIHLPCHTPDHLGYQIGADVFCGASLLHGTARTGFPGGSAEELWVSARKLLGLPGGARV